MKKLIYLLMLAATMSFAFSSCKEKEDGEDDDEIDLTYVVPASHLA